MDQTRAARVDLLPREASRGSRSRAQRASDPDEAVVLRSKSRVSIFAAVVVGLQIVPACESCIS